MLTDRSYGNQHYPVLTLTVAWKLRKDAEVTSCPLSLYVLHDHHIASGVDAS